MSLDMASSRSCVALGSGQAATRPRPWLFEESAAHSRLTRCPLALRRINPLEVREPKDARRGGWTVSHDIDHDALAELLQLSLINQEGVIASPCSHHAEAAHEKRRNLARPQPICSGDERLKHPQI